MRTISSAEETFRSSVIRDEDGDGKGEYGTLREMAGLDPPVGKATPCNPPFIDAALGSGKACGYSFSVILGSALGTDGCKLTGPDANEEFYFATAWPQKYPAHGRFTYVIALDGVPRRKDNGGMPGTYDATSGEHAWPTVGG